MAKHPVDLVLRQVKTTDAALIARLHAESWLATYRGIFSDAYLDGELRDERNEYWDSRLTHLSATDALLLIAELSGAPVGFVCVDQETEPEWGAFLDNLHVLPAHHGRGIGKLLLDSATSWARLRSKQQMYLWVWEQNLPARGFYQRLGWKIAEHTALQVPGGGKQAVFRLVLPLS